MSQIISKLNSLSNSEKWDGISGDKNFQCNAGIDINSYGSPNGNLLHPWSCEPNNRDWVYNAISSESELKNYAQIATDIIQLLKQANDTTNPGDNYYFYMDDTKSGRK